MRCIQIISYFFHIFDIKKAYNDRRRKRKDGKSGCRNQKKELRMAAPCVVLSVLNMSELCALVDAGIVHFYNGKRGLKLKWVFYIFYPLHLLILAGICVLLFK